MSYGFNSDKSKNMTYVVSVTPTTGETYAQLLRRLRVEVLSALGITYYSDLFNAGKGIVGYLVLNTTKFTATGGTFTIPIINWGANGFLAISIRTDDSNNLLLLHRMTDGTYHRSVYTGSGFEVRDVSNTVVLEDATTVKLTAVIKIIG